jgi:hypothetical protein
MEYQSTITILLVVLIIVLLTSLALFITTKYLKHVNQRKAAERYRGKGALLPVANIRIKPPKKGGLTLFQHPSMEFDPDAFRKSFYTPDSPSSILHSPSCFTPLSVPEIRITFPEEDLPPEGKGGQRTSRVVVVQVGESGAAYVTAPPPYEGFQDVDMSKVGGLKEKS